MENLYLILVIVLMVLAVSDLVVGVTNDAVNFLNSSIGSKVAPRNVIMIIASLGIVVGATFSSGMMEVARSGIFHPQYFYLPEIMTIFLAVMLTDIIVLDLFNTFGLPTSTTVSLVFELLGAAVAVSIIKIISNGESLAQLSTYINSAKALAIISGILISVVVAFVVGAIVQYFARLLFTYNYQKTNQYFGSLWGGIALTAITFFILMKGLKGTTLLSPEMTEYLNENTRNIILFSFAIWVILFQIAISVFRLNTLRFIVLSGTFALALAFAGNDLVNFIGVFMAGFKSYQIHLANPNILPENLAMSDLANPVEANFLILLIAGLIMVITLWLSKKARSVTKTEVNLARQDSGHEQFGSSQFARTLSRAGTSIGKSFSSIFPRHIKVMLGKRFDMRQAQKYRGKAKDAPSFDLIRASVNLTVASILISSATSLKLPLSTTYVTFMVAMGSSLSDKAWGRESAVYRITGVLTVISGWFFTAFIAFTIAAIVAIILNYGGYIATFAMIAVVFFLIYRTFMLHKRRTKREGAEATIDEVIKDENVVKECITNLNIYLGKVLSIFNATITALSQEDRHKLREMRKEVETMNIQAKKFKYNVHNVLRRLQADSIETGHYYVQVIDYLREIAHALTFIAEPSLQHIENNHKGLQKEQNKELVQVSGKISELFQYITNMIKDNDYTNVPKAIKMQQDILDMFDSLRKKQIKRVKMNVVGTRNSILYLGIINEGKNIMLHTINLLKAQRDFILKNVD